MMLDYIKSYLSIYGIAAQKANEFVNAERGLYDTISKYYDTVINASRLTLQAKIRNMDKEQKIVDQMIDAGYKSASLKASTNVSMANLFGEILKGMAASRNTLSSQSINNPNGT
jgi:hypothetical protein